jgi:hypothetical protein
MTVTTAYTKNLTVPPRVEPFFGAWGLVSVVVFGLVSVDEVVLQQSEDGPCRPGVSFGLLAAWGRPALPRCSTNVVSSATTIVFGCPPDGSAIASVFGGCPARVLAGMRVAGADRS